MQCLERTLAEDPGFAIAHTSLALLQTTLYLEGATPMPNSDWLEMARDHATRAVSLMPHNARAHTALFWTRFFSSRFDDAFESAQTAMELNPYATGTRARVGAAHMLRGRFDQGAGLIRAAASANRWSPGWQEFFLFLDAHMKGDDVRAARHAMRKSALSSPLGHVAKIIVVSRNGDAAAVHTARAEFAARFPEFSANIAAALDSYAMIPQLRDRLISEIAAAGNGLEPANPAVSATGVAQ